MKKTRLVLLVAVIAANCLMFVNCSGSGFEASSSLSSVSSDSSQSTPSTSPSASPSVSPTVSPTTSPTVTPTVTPSPTATMSPTASPTVSPTTSPVTKPTVLPAPTTTPTTSWLGNSFSGATAWMQDDVNAAFVSSDGTVYTNSFWDEGSDEAGFYKNGQLAGAMQATHGWGRGGGIAITADSNYVYMSMTQNGCDGGSSATNSYGLPDYPTCGTSVWYGVRRYDLNGNPAGFSGGYIYDASMVVVNTSTDITGLAVGGGKLYVADPATSKILIYNTSNMTAAGSFSVTKPGALAYDSASSSLWMIQSGTSNVVHYSTAGAVLATISAVVSPTALAVDNQGRLLVTDNGPDQNVKIFTNIESTPTLSKTFGNVGGQYSTGLIAPLNFGGLSGVGSDSAGNIYVAMNGLKASVDNPLSTSIRSFSSSGAFNWRVFCNEFVSTGVLDASTEVDVYSKYIHYKLDLTKDVGQQATDYAVTDNPLKYPNDQRTMFGSGFAIPVAIRYISGHKFIFYLSMYQNGLFAYRFDGEVAVPSTWLGHSSTADAYPPNHPTGNYVNWIWRDSSGDGDFQANEFASGNDAFQTFNPFVDSNGNVWAANGNTIREFPVQGLDSVGNPIYSVATMKTFPFPGGFGDIERVLYYPATDSMYIVGFLNGYSGCTGSMGATMARFDNFTSGSPKQIFSRATSIDCANDVLPVSMDVAGNAIFLQDVRAGSNTAYAGHAGLLHIYDSTTGAETVSFYPGAVVGGAMANGWTDIPNAIHAYSLNNGRYLVFAEDDAHGKVLMYYW